MKQEELELLGWKHQEENNADHLYHKNFNGHSWTQLRVYDSGGVLITRRRVNKDDFSILYDGNCPSLNDLDYLCKLLGI